VKTQLQEELLGRDYGASLRIGDLYNLVEAVQGVDYAHITIVVKDNMGLDVTASKTNSFGDVEIKDFEVLTMGNTPAITIK
jgi:hypothetical protein